MFQGAMSILPGEDDRGAGRRGRALQLRQDRAAHVAHQPPPGPRPGPLPARVEGDAAPQVHRPRRRTADWAAFNYTGHRDALVNAGRWPAKTTDRSQFVCQFERSDWRFSDCLLKLYDLPGERIADAGMLGRDFTGWSERMLVALRQRRRLPHLLRPVPRRDQEAGRDRRPSCCAAYKLVAGEPDPELQAADLAVHVPARREGPAGQAGHAGEPRRGAVLGHRRREPSSARCPRTCACRGSELFEDVRVPLSARTSSRWSSRRSSRSSRARRSSCWWT